MNNSRFKKVLKNTSLGVALKVVNLLSQFIIRTTLIYILGNQYTGLSGLFSSILSVLSLAELGIGSAITFELYRPLINNDYCQVAKLMNFFKKTYRVIAIVVCLLGIGLSFFLSYFVTGISEIKENVLLLYFLYLSQSVFSYFFIFRSVLITADQKSYIISFIDIIVCIIKTICAVILLIKTKQFVLYLVLDTIILFVRNIVISIYAKKSYSYLINYKDEKLNREEIKPIIQNVYALSLYSFSTVVLSSTDNIIISSFISTALITSLTNYKMIITGIDSLIWQFYNALLPSIGEYATDHKENQQYQIFKQSQFISFCFSLVMSIMLICLLDEFIGSIWLSKEYVMPFYFVVTLVLDFYMYNMLRPISIFRNANGLFIQGKYRPLLMAVLNVLLSIIFVQYWGLFGVIFATVVTRLLTQTWFDPYIVYKHIFKKSFFYYAKDYMKYLLVTIISCGCALFINKWIRIEDVVLSFIVHAIVAVLISIIGILLFYYHSQEFKFIVKKISFFSK